MTSDDLEKYFRQTGYTVELLTAPNGEVYTGIRDVEVPAGPHAGRICDVAILRCTSTPYAMPAAIHTKPVLYPKGTRAIQDSNLGPDWAYWSRRFDRPPTPKTIATHIMTILSEA